MSTTTSRRDGHLVLVAVIAAGAVLGAACDRGVLSAAPPGGSGGAGGGGGTTGTDGGELTGCAAVEAESVAIRQASCAPCHQGSEPVIGSPLDFIMDDVKLVTATPTSVYPRAKYVIPGDPDHSLVYQLTLSGRMPPVAADVRQQVAPSPSVSDLSVLRFWISNCLGALPVPPDPGQGGAGGGAGGYGGSGGVGVGGGSFASCPRVAPSGGCNIDGLVCAYPTGTCQCARGAWVCTTCPTTQPATGTTCAGATTSGPGIGGGNVPLACAYGAVTCSCPGGVLDSAWGCGVCPAGHPASGQACGNTIFTCAYGLDSCTCTAMGWDCGSQQCPRASGPIRCYGIFTCEYPLEHQNCSCGSYWACSCPDVLPNAGSACVGDSTCAYGDTTCHCNSTTWACSASCPSAQPASGDACNSTLSCGYPGGLCYCANGHWTCG